jgi:hypothetical protein
MDYSTTNSTSKHNKNHFINSTYITKLQKPTGKPFSSP